MNRAMVKIGVQGSGLGLRVQVGVRGQGFCSDEYHTTCVEDAIFVQCHVASALGGHLVGWQMPRPAKPPFPCDTVEGVFGLGFGLSEYHITSGEDAICV